MNEQFDYIPTMTVNDEDRELIIRAIEAARHQPRLIDGTWWIWDFDQRTYLDTKGVASFEESTILNTKLEDIISRLETLESFASNANNRYLRKDIEDLAGEVETFAKGAISDSFRSRYYSPGLAGAGFSLTHDEDGSHLEVDYATFRKKAFFYELVIQQISHQGGIMFFTPARIECSEVEITPEGFKCYFDTKSGTVSNDFVVGDQARCQRFELGMTTAKYYWRLVTEVGHDYIVLSLTDADNGSDQPTAGDLIVQFGNRNDAMRQAAKVTTVIGHEAPRDEYYEGIDSYDLTGKLITAVGVVDGKVGVFTENGSFSGTVVIGEKSTGLENLTEWADKESKINEAHSTASAAEKIARNAAESAKRVETLMSEIDDDAILTISEKRTLRTEWETINGVASLSTTGDSGSYMGTKELIDELGYKAGEEVIISYGDAILTHNGIKIKFNNSGIVAFELAYNNLRECLTSVHLYMDETTYNFDRQLVAKALTAYYDAQSRILSQAQSGYSDGLAAKVSKLALNAQSSADAANALALNAKNSAAEAAADAIKAQSTADKAVVDANSAKAAADAAQTTADGSVTKLNEWSSDSVISPFEKQGISDERAFVVADKDDIDNQKAKYSIENEETLYNAYLSAYNAYLADLNNVLSTSDACPVPADMSTHQGAYYQARTALLSAISAAARNVADLAQDAADKAKDAASAAQTTANNAQKYAEGVNKTLSEVKAVAEALETSKVGSSEYNEAMAKLNELIAAAKKAAADAQSTADKAVVDANSAKAAADAAQTTADGSVTKLNEWSSDSVISPFEKQGISDERAFVVADKDDIDNQKAKYSIENEETLYNAYLSAYNAYLADLNNVLSTSDACPVPADMSTHQGAYYQARTALLSAISAAARNVADLAQDAADKAKDAATAAQTTADNAQSSANQAQDRADEAYKYSEKIAWLLSEIDDDSILSTSEKFAIRSEWEKINGAASFSYSGSKGSYPNAVEIANRLGVNMAKRANLTMNGASILYNSRSLSYVESGYRELELAYMSLKDYLISIKIYTNEPVANFDRRALAESLSAYYSSEENFLSKAQKFYTDERSEDTSKLLKADIASLAESLAKDVGYSSWEDLVSAASAGQTIIKGGFLNTVLLKASSILAEHIAAGAITAAKIAAGAITAEKIAAGAITSDKIEAKAINAEKVDIDDLFSNHIEANDMSLNNDCTIGDTIIIKDGKLLCSETFGDYTYLTEIFSGNLKTKVPTISKGGYYNLEIGGCSGAPIMIFGSNTYPYCMALSIDDKTNGSYRRLECAALYDIQDGLSFYSPNGEMAGVRPFVYLASQKEMEIGSEIESWVNTIIAKYTSGEQTIKLPANPQKGDWYRIINSYDRGSNKLVISANHNIEHTNGKSKSLYATWRSVLEYIFDGSEWHQIHNNI